ncbi:LysR family transcriptional regulator [Enterobacter bugandensis]|uniref:helix-turn-helix domain-containing protein n=1 Tax=Enterobacteriaceae TaxID=543 RepID=UPI001887EAE2|nr:MULTISPECIES: LysR family transcriptional regulator [Enterobacteriaceae]HBU6133650.1 LysR family transcriptional regulator [Enterobacter cloacae]MBF2751076.1 LysR family transcriptional regulator [Enterobacter bugandensis]MBF2792895.1 LysR family transcriptional regulator [Enterobacter asburiae]MBF2803784.1 LysR family transcriptional regulator [Enterobacter bugandensis]MCP1116395.1 LysR family transcriptional regulator [Enterobacter bugandensis]
MQDKQVNKHNKKFQEQKYLMDNKNGCNYRHLMGLDFKSLLAFIAVIETGNLYSASLLLGCSQPAISIYLKRVRQYFDKPLFTREGRSLDPTEYALELSKQLKDCFITFDVATNNQAKVKTETSSDLTP